MGRFAKFGAALTLPGIAGIILAVGMSVDANVLVFERIERNLLLQDDFLRYRSGLPESVQRYCGLQFNHNHSGDHLAQF